MKSQMKPPLIVRVALQCRVFVQIADRVAHCVHVLAGDVRFLRIMRETLVVGMGRRAVDLEHSRVGQPCLGCVLNTIAVCHVFCFFHYFVVNDEEAKLPLPVMINVFTEKQIVFTATVPSVFQALPLNMFKSVTDRLCIMGTVATRRQKL